jgi:hypothetical protein
MVGFVGTPTVAERLADSNVLWKSICKRVAYTLRVGLPGKIVAFDPVKQWAQVELQITENVIINEVVSAMPIPVLHDVLVLLPGDNDWCITFPSLIGAECFVCFADMCINAWATSGNVQNQEVNRRHDLSDGFAVLCPRSQPNVIPDYSTTALEIRSMDNTVKIGLDSGGVALTAPVLAWNQVPFTSTTAADFAIPITLDGTIYWLKLSSTP